MPLIEFICADCGESIYAFDNELYTNPNTGEKYPGMMHDCGSEFYHEMPPYVTIIHRTELFMITQLDSVHTIHDLDASLHREAAEDREVKQQNLARKEL